MSITVNLIVNGKAVTQACASNTTLVDLIREEAGKFPAEVLAPLSAPGDHQGARFDDGVAQRFVFIHHAVRSGLSRAPPKLAASLSSA